MGFLLGLAALLSIVAGLYFTFSTLLGKEKPNLMKGAPFLLLSFLFFTAWIAYSQVEAGNIGVVTRFGNPIRTLTPGAHFVTPFIESVYPISIRTLVVKPNEDGASHDLQMVHTQVTLAYHFDPTYVTYLYSNLIDSSDNAVENKVILPAIVEAVKAVTAQYDAQALITQRSAVRDGIERFVKERLIPYHIIAETTSITDFNFSPEFNQAIESKVTAQQSAEKAENVLKQVKIEAEQKIAAAEGEAQALKLQKQQITQELLQLRTIEMMDKKWDGHLPEAYYGGNAPLPIVETFKNVGKK